MCSIEELQEALNVVGFNWDSCDQRFIGDILGDGLRSAAFLQIVRWITDEMRVLSSIEERVTSDASDINSFQMELSGFLKELQCPIEALVTGPVSNRFQSQEVLVKLLNYLLSELMAVKMVHKLKPKAADMIVEVPESASAAAIKRIVSSLNMAKPPANVNADQLFREIQIQLEPALLKAGTHRIGKPLFTPKLPLTPDQWNLVHQFQQELETEYEMRRQMLLTRLDVTVQSFQWSDKGRSKQDQIEAKYTANRKLAESMLHGGESTSVMALLAAREDLTIIEKTSNASIRTQSDIQKHVMGQVPDRGGRANEHAAPPREMPSWTNRSAGRGGGRGASHRGGANNRGGYQPQRQPQQPQNQGYPAQSSGYQQNVGYGQRDQNNGRQSFNNRGGGGGRVQGGWSQQGYNDNRGDAYQPRGGGRGGHKRGHQI